MIKNLIKNFCGKHNKQQRLLSILNDTKISKTYKGWINQEINMIKRNWYYKSGNKKTKIRNPIGLELAHERGRETKKGYGYEHAHFKWIEDHRRQHKFDNMGKKNKDRPYDIVLI